MRREGRQRYVIVRYYFFEVPTDDAAAVLQVALTPAPALPSGEAAGHYRTLSYVPL